MSEERIDHMKYLPQMENIGSEIQDKVISEMENYDPDKYTANDVLEALKHDNITPEDFKALLSPAALPLLEQIAQKAQVDAEDSNPKIAATAFIVKMLAEVRALREGIIIADQLPTAMAPEVIKNTNIKLVHRLTSGDDRELVGSTMTARTLQMENMATYLPGQSLFSYEKFLKPFEMRVCTVEEHG